MLKSIIGGFQSIIGSSLGLMVSLKSHQLPIEHDYYSSVTLPESFQWHHQRGFNESTCFMFKQQSSQVYNINFGLQSMNREALELFAPYFKVGSHENIILNVYCTADENYMHLWYSLSSSSSLKLTLGLIP